VIFQIRQDNYWEKLSQFPPYYEFPAELRSTLDRDLEVPYSCSGKGKGTKNFRRTKKMQKIISDTDRDIFVYRIDEYLQVGWKVVPTTLVFSSVTNSKDSGQYFVVLEKGD
jgi:hypothetical protein